MVFNCIDTGINHQIAHHQNHHHFHVKETIEQEDKTINDILKKHIERNGEN